MGGVAQLRHAQRREPRSQPRQRIQALTAQLLRVAGREHAARHLHLGDERRLAVEGEVKRGIGARRLAQQFEIRHYAVDGGRRRHGLKVDGNFGADDVETDRGTNTTSRPGLGRQDIRRGKVGVSGVEGCYRHATWSVPGLGMRL